MSNNPNDPTPAELAAEFEAFTGKPTKLPAEEGILAMQERITSLLCEMREFSDAIARSDDSDFHDVDVAVDHMAHLRRQIEDCRKRITEYETQLRGRN